VWQRPLSGAPYIPSWWKISPGRRGWAVHTHPLSVYLPPRTKLWCTLQLRGKIHSPYLYSIPICTSTLCNTRGHVILKQTTHSVWGHYWYGRGGNGRGGGAENIQKCLVYLPPPQWRQPVTEFSFLPRHLRHFRAVWKMNDVLMYARRLIRSSRPTEIFQPPQQGFFSVHAQLQLLGNIFQLFAPHPTSPQLTSHLTTLTLWYYI
jgi:hypothetical protein